MKKLEELNTKYNIEAYYECGDGWYDIIEPLIKYISEYNTVHDSKIDIVQIKSKYAGLRFYVDGATPELDEMISQAEDKSYLTCEICGDVGKTRGGWWYETLCDKHYEERERRKYKQTFDYIMSKPDAVEVFQDIMWSKQEQLDKLLDRLKNS